MRGGVRVVAGGVLVEGLHDDPARQRFLVGGPRFIAGSGSLANDWVSNGAWQGPSGLGGTSR
ncbi:hypothetical protein [Streptomyces erythrochromogenes]|uniref:hypothetical protein n=1 Tax=Streptomyces erythrochromogenes TaxID=285574 RepID=UPI0036C5B23E